MLAKNEHKYRPQKIFSHITNNIKKLESHDTHREVISDLPSVKATI